MSPSNTMRNAQELFEGIEGQEGLITYMRTDSPTLSNEAMKDIHNQIINSYGDKYFEKRIFKSKVANAQEAHEAIRPTSISRTPESVKSLLNEYIEDTVERFCSGNRNDWDETSLSQEILNTIGMDFTNILFLSSEDSIV